MSIKNNLFKNKKSEAFNPRLAVRRDVLNKNITRIISRFYKSLLIAQFPNFKNQFKSEEQMTSLLVNLWSTLFPINNSNNLPFALGAFIFAPRIKSMRMSEASKIDVRTIYKCLSKYTHRDMEMLCFNESFKVLYSYFLKNGMEFMSNEAVVKKAWKIDESAYSNALREITEMQKEQPKSKICLDFLDI